MNFTWAKTAAEGYTKESAQAYTTLIEVVAGFTLKLLRA